MSQQFSEVRVSTSARSTFDLSHHQVTTSDFGYLLPICVREMVPNDDFVVTPNVFVRLSPPVVPFYGRVKCRLHHFFVPNRIMMQFWDSFVVNSVPNGASVVPPYFTVGGIKSKLVQDPQFNGQTPPYHVSFPRGVFGRLMSNLGVNPDLLSGTQSSAFNNNERINAFPFIAYYRIWMDYFMDTNINNHISYDSAYKLLMMNGGNLDSALDILLRTRCACYKKDYFTTAKLSPQDGSPAKVGADIADSVLNPGLHHVTSAFANIGIDGSRVAQNNTNAQANSTSKIAQFTIEELRAANSLQRWLERNNYVGSKVINQLLVHYGIAPSAERLDMAEFIGGDSFDVQIGDVTSTTPDYSGQGVGLGAQAGKGVGVSRGGSVRYHSTEHGIFMTLMSILPDTDYYQGLHRMWTRGVNGDYLDYYQPEFENLGYQEVLNKELFVPLDPNADYTSYDPNGIFGYVPRYSDYKFANAVLGSDFVGSSAVPASGAPMDSWHLFRQLNYDDQDPMALNDNFVTCDNHNNNYDRVFQVTSDQFDHFYFNINCDVKATRDMVGFAEPALDANNTSDGHKINLPYGGTRL